MGETPSRGQHETLKIKEVGKESSRTRFNRAVVKELEEKFEGRHDVSQDYFTHAFPAQNLKGIVEQGGLRTPAQLRKRGVEFKTGSNATFNGQIFFSRGFVETGYSTQKAEQEGVSLGTAAMLVPKQEYHRARRINKTRSDSHLHKESDYLDTNSESGGEFVVASENYNADGDDVSEGAERISQAILDKEIRKLKTEKDERDGQSRKEFLDNISNLDLSDPPESLLGSDSSTYKILDGIEDKQKQLEVVITSLRAELEIATKNLEDKENNFGNKKKIIERDLAELDTPLSVFDKISIFPALYKFLDRKKTREIQTNLQSSLETGEVEVGEIRMRCEEIKKKIAKAEEEIKKLDVCTKLVLEHSQKNKLSEAIFQQEKDVWDKKYKTDRSTVWHKFGEGTAKARNDLRRAYDTEAVEDSVRVDVAKSILVIEMSAVEEAIKLCQERPELEGRVAVIGGFGAKTKAKYEKEIYGDGYHVGFSKGNQVDEAFEYLTKTADGFELLKGLQRGVYTESNIPGIMSLAEYQNRQKEGNKAVA